MGRGRGGSTRGSRGTNASIRGRISRGNNAGAHDDNTATPVGSSGRAQAASGGAPRPQRSSQGSNGNGRDGRGHIDVTNTPIASPNAAASSTPTPYAQTNYVERLKALKEDRPHERARLIRDKRMNPDGQIDIRQAVKRKGLCTDMCPEFERVRRIVEDDLKLPEYTPQSLALKDRRARVPDESRMVKAYQRSAAGMETELVTDIRPPSVCLVCIYIRSNLLSTLTSSRTPCVTW